MRKKLKFNIPTGTVRGSQEERDAKAEKNRSQEDKIADYLKFLEQSRGKNHDVVDKFRSR